MSTSAKTTRAWTYNGPFPSGLHIIEQSVPSKSEARESKQILLNVTACALNPVDIQRINTAYDKTKEQGIVNDVCGTVIQADGFKEGDHVFGMTMSPFTTLRGALANVAVLDSNVTTLIKKPTDWSDEQAAAIPLVWLTARICIEEVDAYMQSPPKAGGAPRLVVLGGSSSTGIYSILLAKQRGWNVLATSSAKNKGFVLNTLHADEHVDYTTEDVRARVHAYAPTAIIDCVGGRDCVGVRGNRRYVTIVGDKTSRATMGGPYTYYDYTNPIPLVRQWLRWACGYVGLGERYDVVHLDLRKDWLEEAAATLKPDTIFIDSTFAFDDADKAFARLDTGRAKGKVVVKTS